MKLLLLKFLLQHRTRDEGFTLPMVIAIGLVMILLGAFNILSASEENLTAISQNSRSDALAIAEIGIARYRELLNTNRLLAINNRDQWTAQTQVCTPITDTVTGWANHDNDGGAAGFNSAMWQSVTLDETVIGKDLNNDGDDTDTAANIGWFKIVDYEYDIDGNVGDGDSDGILDDTDDNGVFDVTDDANNDTNGDGNSDARGILTVKGRTPDGSEAQIEVDIPIRINQQDMNNLAPALWIGNGAITADGGVGKLNLGNGNIVLSIPSTGCGDPADIDGENTIADPRGIPPITAITNTVTAAAAAGTGQTNILTQTVYGDPGHESYVQPPSGETFDESVHCQNITDCRYYYVGNSLTIANTSISTDGIAKATLYVDGNINFNATTADVNLGSSVSSNYLEIYGTNNTTSINIDTNGGDVNITALIHAPAATVNITGGGNVNINGSVWVNNWNNTGGATVTITPDDTDISSTLTDKSYEFYTTTANRTPKPLTNSPINWKTEEVQ